jgi:putative ABC transport system permease protein
LGPVRGGDGADHRSSAGAGLTVVVRRAGGRRIHGRTPREDVERELELHLELRTQELVEQGWDEASARAEARRLFGDYRAIRSECAEIATRHRRSSGRARMIEELVQDLRYAVRWLVREPGFALLAVLTLALGIGANAAAFGIVNGVLLAPLPYPQPERLVAVEEVGQHGGPIRVAWPNFVDWTDRARQVELTAHSMPYETTVLGGAEPVRPRVTLVGGDFFRVIGVAPRVGRGFVAEERVPGGAAAVVVSDAFWRQQLGAEPDLTKLKLNLSGRSAQVVGVMPPGFSYPDGAELWAPVEPHAPQLTSRTAHNFSVTGRLGEGVPAAAAQAELSGIMREIRERETEVSSASVLVSGLHDQHVGEARNALLILLAASGFVLLVACTNLASALLARAARRTRELAIRAALGAPRRRLIRQLLTESMLLSLLGALAGLLLAHLLIDTTRQLAPAAIPRLDAVRLDGWVLGFTTLVAIATALTFGTAPALRATSAQPYQALSESGRGTASPRQRRVWSALVGVEVALALMLLVGAGLLIRSFTRVMGVDPGFEAANVLTVTLSLPGSKYEGEARVAYYDRLLEEIRGVPGVESAAVTRTLPLAGFDPSGMFDIEGGEIGDGNAHYRVVSPDFFTTMQTPVLHGRTFTTADRAGAQEVIVINQRLAERHFPDQDPLGARIMTGGMDAQGWDVYATVVGVVGDVRTGSLTSPPGAGYYLPYAQRWDRMGDAALVVRARTSTAAIAEPVRARVRALDGDVPFDIRTYSARIGDSLADRRFMLLVLGTFAGVALVLAAVGIYAVVAFAVAQRTQEIGIRVALGAGASRVLWLVSRSTLTSVGLGVLAGLAGALMLSRILASLLFEVEAMDPLTFAAVALLLVGVAWLAVFVPARRATRVDPLTALRPE